MLKDKTVYCIVTGANRTKTIGDFLVILQKFGCKNIILMPTENSRPFLREAEIPEGVTVRFDSITSKEKIPEEDVIVVAPCTFNTMGKIANGDASSYPLSILHAAIGKKKPIIVAFSMADHYWNHPLAENFRKTLSSFGIELIWPEFLYSDNGEFIKLTMSPWEKVADSVCHKFEKCRFVSHQVSNKVNEDILEKWADTFIKTGNTLEWQHFTRDTAGCLGVRIPEGILATRTGAKVGKLSRDDLTLITKRDNKDIYWVGKFPPSSETPMILELFEHFPAAQAIIHGHCTEITYSPLANKYKTESYLSYGSFGEAKKLYEILEENKIAIMRLHGEVVIGDNFDDALCRYLDLYHEMT